MDTWAKLMLGLGFQADAKSIAQVQNEAGALKNSLSKILSVVGITLTLSGVKSFIQDVSSVAAEVKAIDTQFDNTFSGIQKKATESLNKVSQATGISATRMKQTYTSLASYLRTTGMSANEANEYASEAMYEIANNAAYMDTTLEEAAGYFIKMSKGNYTVDDRMNFDFMQDSRDELAQELYGKNFSDLSKYEQEVALLEKVKRANRDMGAIDESKDYSQAAYEADQYTNQVGELSDALKMLKVAVGNIFLTPLLKVQTKLAEVSHNLADALGDVEDHSSLLYRLSTKLTNATEKLLGYVDKGIKGIKKTVELMGGLDNTLEALSVVIGVIAAFMLADKITSISKALGNVNWKLVGIILLISLIVLIVDDFFGFLNGKDSVFGDFVSAIGLNPDEVRQRILDIKDSILDLKEDVLQTFKDIGDQWSSFMDEHGEDLDKLINDFAELAQILAQMQFDHMLQSLEDVIEELNGLIDALDRLKNGDVKTVAKNVIGDTAKNAIKAQDNTPSMKFVSIGIEQINKATGANIPTTTYDALTRLGNLFTGVKDNAKEASDESDSTYKNIEDGANSASNKVTTTTDSTASAIRSTFNVLSNDALTYGTDFGSNFATGIQNSGLMTEIDNAALAIKNNLGHSKPKEGPLADDDKWMPDMMNNFITGIRSKKTELQGAITSVASTISNGASEIKELAGFGENGSNSTYGNPLDVLKAADKGTTYNITQNISYANTFNGDTRENQITAGAKMRSNANDTSTYLANAIAFGR